MDELKAYPNLMASMVEETLRYEGPLQRLTRTVVEDVEIDGRSINAGQTVLSLLGAANRDPERFENPDQFEIRRTPNKHLAFGHGIHFCIGAPLARLETPIAIATVLQKFPDIQQISNLRYEP